MRKGRKREEKIFPFDVFERRKERKEENVRVFFFSLFCL